LHATADYRLSQLFVKLAITHHASKFGYVKVIVSDNSAPKPTALRHMNGLYQGGLLWPGAQTFEQDTTAVVDGQHARVKLGSMSVL
jgi:hypothetical protein